MSPHPPQNPQPRSAGISRRSFTGKLAAGTLGAAALGTAAFAAASTAQGAGRDAVAGQNQDLEGDRKQGQDQRPVQLGTFGGGIVTATYDTSTGALTADGGFKDVKDPSFLAFASSGKVLYSLDTVGKEGGVRAFTAGEDGALKALGDARSTGGTGVTHLSVHPGGKHLLSANYDSGSVAVHPIGSDGSVGARTDLVQHSGKGPDPDRQAGPHAHQIVTDPGGSFVVAVDLGTDTLYTYALDTGSGTLKAVSEEKSAAGAGPRHIAFHPKAGYAYVANELDNTVTVYAYDAKTGTLKRGKSQPTLPSGTHTSERNYPAEVVISNDQKFLYLSNRGHDSIAWFAIEDGGGSLRLIDTVPSGGAYPRHISLAPSGKLLFAGNQNGNTVGVFTVDTGSGALTASGTPFQATSPVCVLPT